MNIRLDFPSTRKKREKLLFGFFCLGNPTPCCTIPKSILIKNCFISIEIIMAVLCEQRSIDWIEFTIVTYPSLIQPNTFLAHICAYISHKFVNINRKYDPYIDQIMWRFETRLNNADQDVQKSCCFCHIALLPNKLSSLESIWNPLRPCKT